MSDINKGIIEEFRANGGVVGGHFEGMDLLLVHTTGAKSGLERINPVAQISDGDRYVIIASKGGAPTNPDLYYNLKANPEVTIEVGTQKFSARAAITEEPERSELFEKMASQYPGFEDYKEKTKRVIPVITLTRQ
ncbi:MAG: nitroreductase family deazaflavin-dependent oxidoreductase [Anaerolineales bacterium]